MKVISLLLAVGVVAVSGLDLDDWRVTYGPMEGITEYFIKIPRTIEEAETAGWVCTERPPGPLPQLIMYCPPGRNVCPLYTPTGDMGGLQLSFSKDHLYAAAIKLEKWFTKWTPSATDSEPEKEYWTITQYYVSEETLEAGYGPQASNGSSLQDNGIWVHDHSGQLMLIPRTEADIKSKTLFTKQNCTPRMGTHYHYNMTPKLLCENQLPWFALVIDGKLVGSGLQFFGDLTEPTEYKNWFERFRGSTVERSAVPFGPDCLYHNADMHPIFSLHIYLTDPEQIKCRLADSANPSTIPEKYRPQN